MKVYLIPHFHYDVVYCETYEEYLDISFKNLVEMLNIMDIAPQYKFLIEQVILIKEFWERKPEFRDKLKELVKKGRIEFAPGMYVMPDMMLIDGESLIYQIEITREWLKKNFDFKPRVCWITDCWGHHEQLPQILKNCGYECYAFSRAMRLDIIRKSEFYWQGLDGTKIITHWMPIGYDGFRFHGDTYLSSKKEKELYGIVGRDPIESDMQKIKDRLNILSNHAATDFILLPNGKDFGRPQLNASKVVSKWNSLHPECQIYFAVPSEYFRILSRKKIPVIKADFNPAFQGTYSSRIDLKQFNRYLENKLITVQKILVCISNEKPGYNKSGLVRAIEHILYNQFHDVICGSIVDEVYSDTIHKYISAEKILNDVIIQSLDKFNEPDKKEKMFLVFNPDSKEREDIVFGEISFSQDNIKDIKITDEKGAVVPSQIVYKENVFRKDIPQDTSYKFIFNAGLHGMGFKGYRINLITRKQKYPGDLLFKNNILENKFYRLKLSNSGCTESLIHKASGEEFVSSQYPHFNDLVFQIDQGDFWEYYNAPLNGGLRTTREYSDPYPMEEVPLRSRAAAFSRGPNIIECIENGPIRLTVRIKGTLTYWFKHWEFIQYISIYSKLNRIDFKTEFMPQGSQYRLRVCFPTNIKGGEIRHEIPFGITKRPEGEYPALNWIDYGNEKKKICLINKGLPGNNVTNGVMMLSLFRAVNMGPSKPKSDSGFMEGKRQVFEYSLIPYAKGYGEYLPHIWAKRFNESVISRIVSLNKKVLNGEYYFKLRPDNVALSIAKPFNNGLLVRIYEALGKESIFRLKIPAQYKKAYQCNFLGEGRKKIALKPSEVSGRIKPFEIKTIMLEQR